MDYIFDLDPTHSVIRLTVRAEIVTPKMAKDCFLCLAAIASSGGPYTFIYDLSAVTETTLTTEMVRTHARRGAFFLIGRPQVLVIKAPAIFELARIFRMCGESVGKELEVVHSLEEAYEIIGARQRRPEDFTKCLFPKLAA